MKLRAGIEIQSRVPGSNGGSSNDKRVLNRRTVLSVLYALGYESDSCSQVRVGLRVCPGD